ncbi:MAG TPA: hypothetical protein VIL49_10630 [Capillimicrobium sp.]|jgi:hypothetical protein
MVLRPGRLLAGALAAVAVAAPAAAHATEVSVRIAGETAAARLGPSIVDTRPGGTFGPDSCPNSSAGGAIDVAVDGNWDRRALVQTILGETHAFTRSDSWAFWINDTFAQVGICGYEPREGDRILMIADVSDPVTFAPTRFPLSFRGVPAGAIAGEPFTVTVLQHRSDGLTTTPEPVRGATVTAGAASAVTGADGKARLTVDTPGRKQLVATRDGSVSTDPVQLAVAPAEDAAPPFVGLINVRAGARFTPATAPRRLIGTVEDAGPIRKIDVSLLRRTAGDCARLTQRGRFAPSRCRRPGDVLVVARGSRWSVALPRLRPGRYTARAVAVDAAGNRSRPARVRFRVVRP